MSIEVIGVVGAGFMGSGVAESAAVAGKHVIVYEPEQAPLDRSRAGIEASVKKAVSRGKLTEEDAVSLMERIAWTTDFDALGPADGVVEAVVEDPRVKG